MAGPSSQGSLGRGHDFADLFQVITSAIGGGAVPHGLQFQGITGAIRGGLQPQLPQLIFGGGRLSGLDLLLEELLLPL